MRRALALAATPGVPLGPNPRVGCVLLDDDGATVAEGFHRGAGTPHAEVDALARAGDRARGATAVVTLEPCNHTGRTGPCAQALVEAGVRRVVFAQTDPNPAAAGGAETLRAAGVEVESGLLADEARLLNRGLDLRASSTAAVRHLEVRHHPRRPQRRRRRHQPLGQLSRPRGGHPPAARAVRRDAGRHQHRRRRRPAAHRPRRRTTCRSAVQPLRAVMGERDLTRDRRVFDDDAETRPPAHPRPARRARRALRPRPPARLPRGRPDAGRGVPAGRASSTRSSSTSPRCCSAPAARAVADLGITTIADAFRPRVTDVTVLDGIDGEQPNVRLTLAPPRRRH